MSPTRGPASFCSRPRRAQSTASAVCEQHRQLLCRPARSAAPSWASRSTVREAWVGECSLHSSARPGGHQWNRSTGASDAHRRPPARAQPLEALSCPSMTLSRWLCALSDWRILSNLQLRGMGLLWPARPTAINADHHRLCNSIRRCFESCAQHPHSARVVCNAGLQLPEQSAQPGQS